MTPHTKLIFTLGLTAFALGACVPEQPDDSSGAESWDSSYPPIDTEDKYFKPGPVLAGPDLTDLEERFVYHDAVINAYGFSYVIKDNEAVHKSLAELTGLEIPVDSGEAKPKPLPQADMVLPEKWDWRSQGVGMPPIRNQGSCGSCWAFGTVAALEGSIAVFDKQIVNLSEQQVLDCNGTWYSCNGGYWAYNVFLNPGAGLESAYGYTAYDGQCKKNIDHPYKIESYHGISSGNIDAIKAAIYQYGAVGVTTAVCGSFPGYGGGIYDSTECNWAQTNHIVALVGWDDTVTHKKGKGIWIMRNSWGTSWGEQGYMRMAYGTARIEDDATYVIYKAEDPTDTDGDGLTDLHDNCKEVPNGDQVDADQDGKGDACDTSFDPFEKTITLSDDDSRKVDLGFSFPFYGTGYTAVNINSDGNLTFGTPDGESKDRSKSRFLTFAPRIAALYGDLNPAAGGKVSFGKSSPDTFFVKYDNVPVYGKSGGNTVTLSLAPTGDIAVSIGAVSSSAFIVGASKGGAGNSANETDLSAAAGPLGLSGTNAVYEVFGSKALDLANKTVTFNTDGGSGPAPAPVPSETSIALGDDASAKVALGFSFPFFGKTYSDVYVNSDGNLTFGAGDSASANRTASRFLTGSPRIAALYADLDPSAAGTVSYRHDDASSITITYKAVPIWGKSAANTVSVRLDSSGKVTLSYEGVSSSAYVVGVSQGGAGNTGTELDLSAAGGEVGFGGASAVYQAFASGQSFDLSGKTLVFTTDQQVDPGPGPAPSDVGLSLGDDATAKVALGFSFPFFGKSYTEVYVNSDGNLTFGSGDGVTADRTESRFLTGKPRIALLYSDLDPSAGGAVSYRQDDAQTMSIDFTGVPLWGDAQGNTVHVTLSASGTVSLKIDGVSGSSYIVGVSKGGSGNAGSFVDLSAAGGAAQSYGGKGALYEVFSGGFDLEGQPLLFTP